MIKCTNLEVTGNFLEVPPAREPTNARKRMSVTDSSSSAASSNIQRRRSSVMSVAAPKPTAQKPIQNSTQQSSQNSLQRSVSQQSTSNKKQVSASLNTEANNNYEVGII